MSTLFVADSVKLKLEGENLNTKSIEFNKNVERIYDTIHTLTISGYVSEAAEAIAKDIEKYHNDLKGMAKVIKDYGDYCHMASNIINKNEQNIIDNIK